MMKYVEIQILLLSHFGIDLALSLSYRNDSGGEGINRRSYVWVPKNTKRIKTALTCLMKDMKMIMMEYPQSRQRLSQVPSMACNT